VEARVLGDQFDVAYGHTNQRQARASALVVHRLDVGEALLDEIGPGLRVVGRLGTGTDNLDTRALDRRGITWFSVPNYCATELADHATALALALERGIFPQFDLLRRGGFSPIAGRFPRRLSECQAGIIGYGRSGQALGCRLLAIYGRVAAFDIAAVDSANQGVEHTSLELLLAESHAVFLCCPLTPATREMVNERFISQLRPDAIVINTARGGLVDARAVTAALVDRRLRGAAFDVFEPEDPSESPDYQTLFKLPNVIATCHRGNLSTEAVRELRVKVAVAIQEYFTPETM
jgi:phosphoglycerate dehydrogenase-like enzyme